MTKFHIPEFYVQARKFKTPVFSLAKKAYRTFCRNYLLCCTEYGRTAHEAFFFSDALKNSRKNALTIDLMQKNGYYIQCR